MKILKAAFLTISLALTALLLSPGCGDGNDEQADVGCEDALCIGTLFRTGGSPSSIIKAAEFARDDINKAGGNVKLIAGDGATPLASAMELLEMGVKAIIGPGTSAGSVEIFDFLVENSLVAVSPSATSVTLTENNQRLIQAGKTPFFFRTTATDNFQAKILAHQAQGEVLIVHRDDNYGEKLTELINENLRSQNRSEAKVVKYEPYNYDDTDADEKALSVVADVEAVSGIGNVDSIIVIAFREGGKTIKGMLDSQAVPPAAQYYVSDGLALANLYEYVDETNPGVVAGLKAVSPTGLPNPPERKPEFEARFDRDEFPSLRFATHMYDAVVVVALASLSAESTDPSEYVSEIANVTRKGNQCISYAECAAALADETSANDDIDYEGLSGPIKFDENGDIEEGFYLVYTYDLTGKRDRRIFSIPELEDVTPDRMP